MPNRHRNTYTATRPEPRRKARVCERCGRDLSDSAKRNRCGLCAYTVDDPDKYDTEDTTVPSGWRRDSSGIMRAYWDD